jgi:putative copper export protein/mono/diheme cytochrome c family protein
MTAAAGLAIRWLQFLSCIVFVGAIVHALLALPADRDGRRTRLGNAVPWLSAALAGIYAFAVLALVWQVASAIGGAPGDVGWPDVGRYLAGTRAGRVWLWRHGLALSLLAALPFAIRAHRRATRRAAEICTGLLALGIAYLASAAFSGHGVGGELAAWTVTAHVLHLTAASLWLGGLLFLTAQAAGGLRRPAAWAIGLPAFSRFATGCMAIVTASGLWLAYREIGGWPGLFGTGYGRTLLTKLALLGVVLACAATLRWRHLPRAAAPIDGTRGPGSAAKWLVVECTAAILLSWCATKLGLSVPARHDDIDWPLSFRLAPSAAWALPGAPERLGWGIAALAAAVSIACFPILRGRWIWRGMAFAAAVAGVVTIGATLSVPAFPDTYRRSPVPYQAASIAAGRAAYRMHCAACHGDDATGRGPLAASLPKPPADLTAPHSADHTPGDLYWWLTHGIPGRGMPAFASLSEETRWDLVNYLHAISSSYQARVLRERAVPGRPWLAAPDFDFVDETGAGGALKDFRERTSVLIVLYSDCAVGQRIAKLAGWGAELRRRDAALLIVPFGEAAAPTCPVAALPRVRDGNEAIAATYGMFRHALENLRPGDGPPGPAHMEFLVDRFGYLRARWVPEDVPDGWRVAGELLRQLDMLAGEPAILPPPDEHLH